MLSTRSGLGPKLGYLHRDIYLFTLVLNVFFNFKVYCYCYLCHIIQLYYSVENILFFDFNKY